jgi:type I restriction enzyme, R subunit
MTPEARARQDIDHLLSLAGWHICNISDANDRAARGVAIREFPMLGGVEGQSARYTQGLPAGCLRP